MSKNTTFLFIKCIFYQTKKQEKPELMRMNDVSTRKKACMNDIYTKQQTMNDVCTKKPIFMNDGYTRKDYMEIMVPSKIFLTI